MAHIGYYMFGQSPFASLGHRALCDMADQHGATIALKPMHLHALWANSGARPTAEQPAVRQSYESLELQRAAHARGIVMNLRPRHFPIDSALADRCAVAIVASGGDAFEYVEAVGGGVWCEDANLSEPVEIAARLRTTRHDADAVMAQARQQTTEDIRKQNTADAIAADAVGVPAYALNGEVFFGQDRIRDLERAIIEGRAPFTQKADVSAGNIQHHR